MAAVDTPRARRISVSPPTVTSASCPAVRIAEDGFVSEATVDGWVRAGDAVRAGGVLAVRDGRRFLLRDAVRVLGRRNGDTDPYGFTGRVEAIRELIRRGASISADALRLGHAVYDIEYGVIALAA
jgi:hypothetical protein